MAQAPGRDGVREARAGALGERHALHLDVGRARIAAAAVEPEVEARSVRHRDLPSHGRVAAEGGQRARGEEARCEAVREVRVHADPGASRADHLERVGQLARRARGTRAAHRGALAQEPAHAARVRAVHRERLSGLRPHVREEALVAPHERPAERRGNGERHGDGERHGSAAAAPSARAASRPSRAPTSGPTTPSARRRCRRRGSRSGGGRRPRGPSRPSGRARRPSATDVALRDVEAREVPVERREPEPVVEHARSCRRCRGRPRRRTRPALLAVTGAPASVARS